jgi:hypothetical protein
MIMNNLHARNDNVISTWDNIPYASKTFKNLMLRLFQQETRLKNRFEGNVEKVTTYATLLKAGET